MCAVQMWGRCEALTAGLASELAEQLRLILEPTLASKLAGKPADGLPGCASYKPAAKDAF